MPEGSVIFYSMVYTFIQQYVFIIFLSFFFLINYSASADNSSNKDIKGSVISCFLAKHLFTQISYHEKYVIINVYIYIVGLFIEIIYKYINMF